MALYHIDNKISELINTGFSEECIDEETGEFYEDKFNELIEQYTGERSIIIENIALSIKNLVAEAEDIKQEENALAERRKAKENRAQRLKNCLSQSLLNNGDNIFETSKVKISFRKSEKTIITDKDKLPPEYVKEIIEHKPDTAMIKTQLKAGIEVPGAMLETCQNLQIK